jgi:hypothetical protein
MARWKLIEAHYLFTVDPVEWEYNETNRSTGKQVRKRFHVPRFLDPKDPGDWTNTWGNRDNQDGEIIVCLPDKGEKGDIAFTGDPTPSMIPVDDEAIAISKSFEHQWSYKPESAEITYSQSLVDRFEAEKSAAETATPKVEIEGLSDLVAAIAAQSKMVGELIQSSARRV